MQLKKLLQGSAFALVAAACAIAVPSVVKAAGEVTGTYTDSKVTVDKVDGAKAQMTAKVASTEKELLVGFAKVSKGKVTVSTWDTYDGSTVASTGVTIDLSKLSNTKDNYIALTTPNALAKDIITIVKIPAAKKVFKAEFDGATAGFSVGEADKGKPTLAKVDATSGVNYEYRTAYSSWTKMVDNSTLASFTMYQEEGANIFVRKVGTEQTTTSATQGSDTYKFGANDKLKAYETTATLPGKEAKVAIKAKAKGPSISGDYAKGTVKLPKKAEYRIVGGTKVGDAVSVGDSAKTMTADELKTAGTAAIANTDTQFSVEVRTAADTAKKKAASKWSRLTVSVPQKLTDMAAGASGKALVNTGATAVDSKKTNGKLPDPVESGEVSGGGAGIKSAVLKEEGSETSSLLAISYVTKGKLDATKNYTSNAVEIQNNGKAAYEIIVGASGATEAPTGKTTKIAAGKKVVLTKVDDGATVWIRKAGDKKTKTWVSEFAQLGVIDHTFKVPKKEATTP